MMNGVAAGGKALLIKQALKCGGGVSEIVREMNVGLGYVNHIKNCLKNNLPTNFYQKKFRSCNPEKRNKERKENYDRGAKYDSSSRRDYSKREEELILKFKGTDRELAKLIGRSVRAIQVKRAKIKKDSDFIVGNIFEPAAQLQDIAL